MRDFSIFKIYLSSQYLSFIVFVFDSCMKVIELWFCIIFNLLHRSSIVLQSIISFSLHTNNLLTKHIDGMWIFYLSLSMHSLDDLVLIGKNFYLLLLVAYLFSKTVNMVRMRYSCLLPFTICNINIFLVLLFESFNCFIKLKLILSLNSENFLLKFLDKIF